MSEDHYKEYLSSVHGKLQTPDDLISDIVKEGSGQQLAFKQRIISGEANEVYDVTTSGDQHVILRVSPHGHPDFQQEIWAINEAKKV
ncbi:MAG: Uncharacterized protein G01um101493_295, partial [Microgenomates group bacterium Gr01-1014_93]